MTVCLVEEKLQPFEFLVIKPVLSQGARAFLFSPTKGPYKMTAQPTHSVREAVPMTTMTASSPILPAVIEHTARKVFESFTEKMKASLNGREDRALKLAVEGHVTHKFARTFNVRSEDNQHSYLVNLEKSFCTCPDSQKGHVCKHRLAAYLVEQAMKTNGPAAAQVPVERPVVSAQTVQEPHPEKPDQMTPEEETIEKVRLALHARSQYMREAIIFAKAPFEDGLLPVEILELEGDVALVRALPQDVNGSLLPRFPFPGRKSFAQVIARTLSEVKIYR